MCRRMWLSSSGPAGSWAAARAGGLRLRKWAHMLGFGGHFSTKSRRYSTTLGALRRARVAYAIRRRRGTLPLDAWGRPEDDQAVIVVASWHYLGSGYQTNGEAWLAASAAARAREAAADRQGGATHHDHDRRIAGAGPECWTGC